MKSRLIEKTWYLIVRSSIEEFHEYQLRYGRNKIGRAGDNDIILKDLAASGHHAELTFDKNTNTIVIRDLNSTNGTYVNGKKIYISHVLQKDDQIRIGHSYFSIINNGNEPSQNQQNRFASTRVTGDLILESVDQYGVLLHEIGQRLVNIPDLDNALIEISVLIQRMIGAETCKILLEKDFENLNKYNISDSVAQKIIQNKTALIFSGSIDGYTKGKLPKTRPIQSMLLVPVVLDQQVVALIFARKSKQASNPFTNSDLQLVLAVSNQVAISFQRSLVESELIHISSHDSLTDLPNRTIFLERLGWSIARSKQEKDFEFAVLFFDIDDFKDINDSLGHIVGDKLLIAIAERLKHNVRELGVNSIFARFGGDEFAILLNDIKGNLFALAVANRLKDLLSIPFKIDQRQIFSTVSIGIAVSSIGYEKSEDVLQDADMAMYQAKKSGKARIEIYDKAMHERVSARLSMGTALRQGALQKEFRLHYQPIISLQTGKITGFEALMRWYTPDQGILYPADFFHAIDTSGLIYTTDHWVLSEACAQTVEWQNKFSNIPQLFISVNLSAKNIKHPNLLNNIKHILNETKIAPDTLHLEITEKVSTPDDENAISVLKQLRSMGIRISLDDFGTGYSALNYLARMPIDILKIDRSFIQMIGKNDDSQKVIEMIKTLANHLGLIVVAEGVEKIEQISYLKSISCEYAQGFYYAKPLDSQAVAEFLESKNTMAITSNRYVDDSILKNWVQVT